MATDQGPEVVEETEHRKKITHNGGQSYANKTKKCVFCGMPADEFKNDQFAVHLADECPEWSEDG